VNDPDLENISVPAGFEIVRDEILDLAGLKV